MGERRVTADGRILEKQPDGSVIVVGQQQGPQGAIPIGPRSGAPQQRTRDNARQDRIDAENLAQQQRAYQLNRAKTIADLEKEGKTLDANDQPVPIPNWRPAQTPAQSADRNDRARALGSLVQQINRTQELGNSGPLATSGIAGIADYNPLSGANAQFDTSGAQLSQQGLAAFRVPGTGTVSDRDAMMFDRGNLPQASNLDAQNSEILHGLRARVNNEYEALGLPAPKWVSPLNQASPEAPAQQGAQGSVLNAITGNTRTRFVPDDEVNKTITAMYNQGRSHDEIAAYVATKGYRLDPPSKEVYDYAKKHPGWIPYNPAGKQVPLSRMEELSGSPTGRLGIGIGNAGSFGLVKGLAGDQYNQAESMSSGELGVGEMLGSVGGSALVNRIGQKAAQGLGPIGAKLLYGGGKSGTFARNLASDTTYAGLYGAGSGDGVGNSALAGALGSAGGQGVGKVLGGALGGLSRAPGARKLADAGVPMTVGQNAGGVLKGIEDRMAGYPIVGDIIGNRRVEGFQGFERAAMNEAGAPIGAKFDGGNWSEQLPPEFGQAYDNATAGANVPLDPQFNTDLQQLASQSRNLPPDLAQRFTAAMDNRMQPIAQAGQMTGETYQQGMRGLSGYKSEMTKPGFEADYRDALSGAQDVLKNQMMRGGGSDVVEGLGKADQGYRMAKVVQEAQRKAVNGTGSGVPNLFTPAQLNTASMANMKKFGGKRPFSQLAAAGQQVLPSKIPDSGTAGRLAQLALPATIAGGAGAGGYAMGGGEGATTGGLSTLGALAALSLGGTKGGQKAINALLFKRPNTVKGIKAQRAVRKLQGLFGSAAVPLALESGN